MEEKILVIDFGGQYSRLIARRVREQGVYAEILPWRKATAEALRESGCKGVILTGGPQSVPEPGSPKCERSVLHAGVPVLGICYGCQLMAYLEGGKVGSAGASGEYGGVRLTSRESALFSGCSGESTCWMSHTDRVLRVPEGFAVTASTEKCPVAAMENDAERLYGVQFHPEVTHTERGTEILRNFLYNICGCAGTWHMGSYAERTIEKYRTELAGKRALCGLSGGVDSAVAAALLDKAMGDRLVCVFVDHGLLREGEAELVERAFKGRSGLQFVRVDARERFLSRLKGVTEPEQKRRIIGEEFVRVFEAEARRLGSPEYLVQGTIYPDVIESGSGEAATIKSHHNVGGLPKDMDFKGVVEPLRELFKDEVRALGRELGLPKELVDRQPFPGPGLAVRVIGEVTEERLRILRRADAVFRDEIAKANLEHAPDQYFAVLTDTRSVGVRGDARSYGETIALRAVTTDDFMTADWTRLPLDVLARASDRITGEVPEISRVVYDITSKPPATVEWE